MREEKGERNREDVAIAEASAPGHRDGHNVGPSYQHAAATCRSLELSLLDRPGHLFCRREFGQDVAWAVLGHASPVVTEVYPEMDQAKASEAMGKID